jgi:hypothetical protein
MIVKADVRMAIELAYELSQQIAQLDLASAFPSPCPAHSRIARKAPQRKANDVQQRTVGSG